MSLLKDRDFSLLFAGQGISRFGEGLYTAATAWPAWSPTKDPTAVTVVSVSAMRPRSWPPSASRRTQTTVTAGS
ncbi:hypothetical protein AB0G67_45885 [Streptomyces sp. NPDC021056]|uniref:hypothetical protein n=1 Tax=Streptomyces sp. NPDC021056 TaxID=3155012 RepID=UPI0033F80B99